MQFWEGRGVLLVVVVFFFFGGDRSPTAFANISFVCARAYNPHTLRYTHTQEDFDAAAIADDEQ